MLPLSTQLQHARTEAVCSTSARGRRAPHALVQQLPCLALNGRPCPLLAGRTLVSVALKTQPDRRIILARSSSTESDWGPPNPTPQLNDPVSLACQKAAAVFSFIVANLADMLQSVAVRGAPRPAVENTVRGALALLSLWLVQEVVGTVLLLGCVGLALYAANQVFGMRLPDVSSFGDGPPSSGRAQAPGGQSYGSGPASGSYDQYGHQYGGRYRQTYGGGSGASGAQQQYGSAAPPYGAYRRPPPRAAPASPVVDVYYEDLGTAPKQGPQQPPQQDYGFRR